MELTQTEMLDRFMARDQRYDGVFITGVLTTGIYCLPSCPARNPKAENVRFFPDESEARQAGLRPCKRCRPDNFYRQHDPDLELVRDLGEEVRSEPWRFDDVNAMAAASDTGITKLSALFRRHWHTSPAAFLIRARIDAACHALAGSRSRVLDVALDVGFDSASAFNANFRRLTGLSPTAYKRLADSRDFTLSLPTDYREAPTLAYWGRDGESLCEATSGRRIQKALHLEEGPAVLEVVLEGSVARCRLDAPLRPSPSAMRATHAMATRLIGLGCEPGPFERRVREDGDLVRLIEGREGLRIPQSVTVFEGLTWAIIGQQVNLGFASTLRRRLVELAGVPVSGETLAHPTPQLVADIDPGKLQRHQFSRSKANYLVDAARAIVDGRLPVEELPTLPATVARKRLEAVRGIGPWTAAYVMLRSCGFADCVPVGDSGLRSALTRFHGLEEPPDEARTLELLEPFAPHRSLATYHLWTTLGGTE